ncbi:Crp/Fnr family transcriptional regulator [Acidithiobacillus sp. AMEEHan]|uniref:Crp/Fnr family transcriptional regulator n=1 Tax=Acidithiobacillus sp. AMEEHan TaxID=2994951 RepID=UPI0027E530C7|nr:Crp/Fnr family transcriptional regulator [Acidithiobacillus sp. AMEEHan]
MADQVMNLGLSPCGSCPIHRWSIFAGLSTGDLQQLPMPVYDLQATRGTVLSHEGQPAATAFVVRSGVVKLEKTGPRETHLVQLLRSGDIWGFEGLDQSYYQHTATILENAHICSLEVTALHQWCEQEPRVRQAIRMRLQQAHQETENHLLLVLSASAELRVAGFLTRWCRDFPDGQKISLPLHREELASHLGMSTAHLSRIMAKFKRQHLIREQHGWIQVDYQRLRNLLFPEAEASDSDLG